MKRLLEIALNHYLALDPESRRRMLLLESKVVRIELLGIGLIFQLTFTQGKIVLHWNDFAAADITIKGTPLNLLHMSLARDQRQRFFAEDVVIEGNMELAQYVLAIFDELEIDWEEQTSRFLGDVPAHQLGRFARKIKKMRIQLEKSLLRNINEYVHEEKNLFPPPEALQDFFNQVDALRMDVDRLEARVERMILSLKTDAV